MQYLADFLSQKAKKKGLQQLQALFNDGAPGRIRTHDPLVRSQVLYPTELRAQGRGVYHRLRITCHAEPMH